MIPNRSVWQAFAGLAACVVLTASSFAQQLDTYQSLDIESTSSDWALETGDALVIDPQQPRNDNPDSFRWFGRTMIGGVNIRDEASFSNEDDPSRTLDLFETQARTRALGSFEFMLQHAFDSEHGRLNNTPEWRLTMLLPGIAVDAGRLPITAFPARPIKRKGFRAWLLGSDPSVNYAGYGLRLNALLDRFDDAISSPSFGEIGAETRVDHAFIGPQLMIGRVEQRGRWRFDLSGYLAYGVGRAGFEQRSRYSLAPGFESLSPNNQANARIYAEHDESGFAALGEIRSAIGYQIRPNWSLDILARFYAIGPYYDAITHTGYDISRGFQLAPPDKDVLVTSDIFIGVTYVR